MLELHREVRDVFPCALADDEHLTEVGFGLGMAFETVLVSALFLADLAVPAQALEPLRLHLIGEVLRRPDCRESQTIQKEDKNGPYLPREACWANTRKKYRG